MSACFASTRPFTRFLCLGVLSWASCAPYGADQDAGLQPPTSIVSPSTGSDTAGEAGTGVDVRADPNGQASDTNAVVTLSPSAAAQPSSGAVSADDAGEKRGSGYLASGYDPTACLDHPDIAYDAKNTLLQMWTCNYTTTQSFEVSAEGTYMDRRSGRCLTGNALSGGNSSYVSLSVCGANASSQTWDRVNDTLMHRQSKKCLDLVRADSSQGQKVQLSPCSGSVTQKWIGPRPLTVKAVEDATPSANTIAGRCAPRLLVLNKLDDANNKNWTRYFPDVASVVSQAILNDCQVLFAAPSDVPPSRGYLKVVLEWNIEAAAYVSGPELHINASYFVDSAKAGNASEGPGVLHHEVAHFYQVNSLGAPTWLIEGMADFVRYRTGYVPLTNRRKGGSYTDSYQVTGFFLDYVERQYPGTMRRLELDLWQKSGGWTLGWFANQTGKDVDSLWRAYQASF